MSGQDSVLNFLVNHGSTVGVIVLASLTTLAGMFLNRPERRAVEPPRQSAKEENIMEYMCGVRLLLSGDMIINSYDVLEQKNCADWVSPRMARLSAEAVDLCFVDCLKALLYSKAITNVPSMSEEEFKKYRKRNPLFCGYSSYRKLDEESKMVDVLADKDGNLKLVPMKYERSGGFSHGNELTIHDSLHSGTLLENLRKAFALSVGSGKWNTGSTETE
ncbi:MAG: hypothetical protein IKU14_10840 [Rhodocyclaceae bacterium]|nr:hypothetical protein [Rhodocyclaceae bacterium]